jgi:hypothetical protein
MEGRLMATVVALNASPAEILRSLRGMVTAARRAYPDVLHVEVRDSRGDLWRLATQDAEWSPSDPADLLNHSIQSADLDENSGELRLDLSESRSLKVVPAAHEAEDDPPNWKLLTPDGLVLIFGPGGRWQLDRASEPTGSSKAESHATRDLLREVEIAQVRAEALRLEREEVLHRLSGHDSFQLLIALAVGLSIISVAIAAVSLAFALQ